VKIKTQTAAVVLPVLCSVLYFLFKLFNSDIIIHNSGYTYLRYAYNIISGCGYSYNADRIYTYGTAGVLNTFIIVILKSIFKSTLGAYILVFSAALFAGASLLGLYLLLFDRVDLKKFEMCVFGSFAVTWIIFFTPFIKFVLAGEDTCLSIALIILTIALLYRLEKEFRLLNVVLYCVSFWLCYNARIENLFFISIFAFLFVFLRGFTPNNKKVLLSLLVIIVITDAAVKYFVFNSFLPLPFYAKKIGFLNYFPTGKQSSIYNLKLFLLYASPYVLVLIFTVTKSAVKTVILYLLPLLSLIIILMFADHSEAANARYFYPLLFPLVILSFYTLSKFTDSFIINKDVLMILFKGRTIYAGLFILLFCVINFGLENYYDSRYSQGKGDSTQQVSLWKKYPPLPDNVRSELLTDIINTLPGNSKAAVLLAGFSLPGKKLNLIDLSGCNNTEIAKNGFSFDIISQISPDIILLPDSSFKSLNEMIVRNEGFNKEFIYLPNVLKSGLAINRKNYQAAKDILDILRNYYRKQAVRK